MNNIKFTESRDTQGEDPDSRHGIITDQGHVDPQMGGGNYRREIAHQPVAQFFFLKLFRRGAVGKIWASLYATVSHKLEPGEHSDDTRAPRPPHMYQCVPNL